MVRTKVITSNKKASGTMNLPSALSTDSKQSKRSSEGGGSTPPHHYWTNG